MDSQRGAETHYFAEINIDCAPYQNTMVTSLCCEREYSTIKKKLGVQLIGMPY